MAKSYSLGYEFGRKFGDELEFGLMISSGDSKLDKILSSSILAAVSLSSTAHTALSISISFIKKKAKIKTSNNKYNKKASALTDKFDSSLLIIINSLFSRLKFIEVKP